MLIITGHSDDLIEVDGDIVEEFTYGDEESGDLLGFSDGTLLRVKFDTDGIWRITPIARGSAALHVEQEVGADGTDRATLDGDVRWVLHGGRYLTRKAGA